MLNANVIPPTPEAQRDKMRSVPAMNAAIVPPSPSAPQRDIPSVRVPGSQAVAVVPPPVSAPEQATNAHPRLTLPPPSVIAPAPTQITRDINPRGPGFGAGELQNQVVPPPASMGDASTTHRTFGGLGNAAVVPPPVQLNGTATGTRAVGRFGDCECRASSGPGRWRLTAASDDDGIGRGNRCGATSSRCFRWRFTFWPGSRKSRSGTGWSDGCGFGRRATEQ